MKREEIRNLHTKTEAALDDAEDEVLRHDHEDYDSSEPSIVGLEVEQKTVDHVGKRATIDKHKFGEESVLRLKYICSHHSTVKNMQKQPSTTLPI